MFTRNKRKVSDSTVLVINESYWKELLWIKRSSQLFLCKAPNSSKNLSKHKINKEKYEIIFRDSKTYSLCRVSDIDVADSRFNCLKAILNFIFQEKYKTQKASFVTKTFQKLIDTIVDHPNWLDVHVSAFNGLVDFFKQNQFNEKEINAQREPDLMTPLHLAIIQGFVVTIEAILFFRPDVNLMDCDNNTILHYAVLSKPEVLEIILNIIDIRELFKVHNKNNNTPVGLACSHGMKDNLVRLLLFGLTAQMLTIENIPQKNFPKKKPDGSSKIVSFSKEDIDQLDLTVINSGGCPLHWALTTSLIEKMLLYFPIDTRNLAGETALMFGIRRNRFHCILCLLYNNADVNLGDLSNETPLHATARAGNVNLVRALIVFDAHLNMLNNDFENPRHLSAIGKSSSHKEILYMLNIFGQFSCNDQVKSKCSNLCLDFNIPEDCAFYNPENSQYFINYSRHHHYMANAELNKMKDIRSASEESQKINVDSCMSCSSVVSSEEKPPKSRMICFDGGGVKGLFTIQMMIELERHLKGKLVDYFDWISGTSTGSMIAFCLAKGDPLRYIRKSYFMFKDHILTGSRPYSSEKIEKLFQEYSQTLNMSDILHMYRKYLVVTATRIDTHPPSLQLFRSYQYPKLSDNEHLNSHDESKFNNVKIWKALRASSSAPTFFQNFYPFIDGGMICNNPTLDTISEFFKYQSSIKHFNQTHSQNLRVPELELVLSFGTGDPLDQEKDLTSFYNKFYYFINLRSSFHDINRSLWVTLAELVKQVKTQVTNCNNHVVWRSDSWCSSLNILFYRINSVMSKAYQLDETNDMEIIKGLFDVKIYAHRLSDQFKAIAMVLDEKL